MHPTLFFFFFFFLYPGIYLMSWFLQPAEKTGIRVRTWPSRLALVDGIGVVSAISHRKSSPLFCPVNMCM